MKITVIDGQGGGIGKILIERLKSELPQAYIVAVGTNSMATSAMVKAGADGGATGENAIIVNCADADFIIGPIGILVADSMLGEVTTKMSVAIGKSKANKVLIPISKCKTYVAGIDDKPMVKYINDAIEYIKIKN